MLHENPLMADIDVNHWRNMQSLLLESAKSKRRIIVIHENGEILKFVHTHRVEIIRTIDRVTDSRIDAKKIFEDNLGKCDFVMILERRVLEKYFGEVQNSWNAKEDLDVYVHRMFSKLDEYPEAVVTYPNKASSNLGLQWRIGSSHEAIVDAAQKYMKPNSSLVIGVFDKDELWATLVLGFDSDLKIDNVTTVDPTELSSLRGFSKVSESVVEWVSKTYTPVSVGLFMDVEIAKSLFATDDKKKVLVKAMSTGQLLATPLTPEAALILK